MRILGKRIMVTADNVDSERVKDGIVIPKGVVDLQNDGHFVKVLLIGDRVTKFKVGDTVFLPRFSGHPYDYEGQDVIITNEDDIPAIAE